MKRCFSSGHARANALTIFLSTLGFFFFLYFFFISTVLAFKTLSLRFFFLFYFSFLVPFFFFLVYNMHVCSSMYKYIYFLYLGFLLHTERLQAGTRIEPRTRTDLTNPFLNFRHCSLFVKKKKYEMKFDNRKLSDVFVTLATIG